MTEDGDFASYIPRITGLAPSGWVEGMPWSVAPEEPEARLRSPAWISGTIYIVPINSLENEAARKLRVQQLIDASSDMLAWLNTLAATVKDPVVQAAFASDKLANLKKALLAIDGMEKTG